MYQVIVDLPEDSRDWCERRGFEPVKRFESRSRVFALEYFTMLRQLSPEGTKVSFQVI